VYSPSVQNPVQKIVQDAGCLIGIGAWTTGKDVNNQDILSDSVALASHGGVIVGPQFFPSVTLGDYIDALRAALKQQPLSIERYAPQRPELLALAAEDSALTYDSFFQAIENWISREHAVVSDAGFPLLGAQSIHISEPNGFVAQASWLAIGYSTPAAVGVKCAMPDKRVVVLVGDGAFQETCQSVSSQHYLGHNTVVFVLANGIYGIEQKLVNPNPFRTPPTDYQNPLLDAVYPYNELHDWAYEKLPAAWGGQGRIVATVDELMAVLAEINEHPRENFVVNVRLPKVDVPGAVRAGLAAVGEDETENPAWPPSLLF
jgi:indolepyruvate decarboxylase